MSTPKTKTPQTTTIKPKTTDLHVPLSKNLIIGFFFDMIHDFSESSIMTGDFKTDVIYLIDMFDAVFSNYWPMCKHTLQQIVEYINYEHYKGKIEPKKKSNLIYFLKPNANLGFISSKYFIQRAHNFFYTLITRQGLNNGELTFNYDYKKNNGPAINDKSKILDINKVAGGGDGLPCNYFIGRIKDHNLTLQNTLNNNSTSASVYASYMEAKLSANIQSHEIGDIKMINLSSPNDYTDSMGSWEKKYKEVPTPQTPQKGGNNTLQSEPKMNVLKNNASKLRNEVAKPMYVVEDAIMSFTQFSSLISLNNKFVFNVGKDNKFNLVKIKSTAETYDMAPNKLQNPPELYDKGIEERKKVLARISNKQASCYDYYFRKFNIKFCGYEKQPKQTNDMQQNNNIEIIQNNFNYPIVDFSNNLNEYINLSIGPNIFNYSNTAILTLLMGVGSELLNKNTSWETEFLDFIKYILTNEKSNYKDAEKYEKYIKNIQNKLTNSDYTNKLFNTDLNKNDDIKTYLTNFSYSIKTDKNNEGERFPTYYNQNEPIKNIKPHKRVLSSQLYLRIKIWLDNIIKLYNIDIQTLINHFIESSDSILLKKVGHNTGKKPSIKNLFDHNYESFCSFITLCITKSKYPKKGFIEYAKKLYLKDINKGYNNYYLKESLCVMMTIINNINLLVNSVKKILGEEKIKNEDVKNDIENIKNIWKLSIEQFLTENIISGCSKDSEVVIKPNGNFTDPSNVVNIDINYDYDVEREVKEGSSVSNILHKWRLYLINKFFPNTPKGNIPKNKSLLIKLSNELSQSRKEKNVTIHKTLSDYLKKKIKNLSTKKTLCKSFGILFQKTAGDFFQVKIAQFLNDNENCFASCLEEGKCIKNRHLYRPYAENPYNKEAVTNFEKLTRPIISPAVQLVTFDTMASLIALQQTSNIILQTVTKTELSPGTALYGTSNIGAPIRKYIETELHRNIHNDDKNSSSNNHSIITNSTNDDITYVPSKPKTVDLDIDLISVLRKYPNKLNNITDILTFLEKEVSINYENNLLDILNQPYSELTKNKDINNWQKIIRVIFDYLCYYKGFRVEESLARTKIITYLLYKSTLINETFIERDIVNKLASVLDQSVSISNKKIIEETTNITSYTEEKPEPVISPKLNKNFFQVFRTIYDLQKKLVPTNEEIIKYYFKIIIELTFKKEIDKKIQNAQNKLNSHENNFLQHTEGYLNLFQRQREQDDEIIVDYDIDDIDNDFNPTVRRSDRIARQRADAEADELARQQAQTMEEEQTTSEADELAIQQTQTMGEDELAIQQAEAEANKRIQNAITTGEAEADELARQKAEAEANQRFRNAITTGEAEADELARQQKESMEEDKNTTNTMVSTGKSRRRENLDNKRRRNQNNSYLSLKRQRQSGGNKSTTFHKYKNGKFVKLPKARTLKKENKKSKDSYEIIMDIFKELNFKV
jgi:hypothetical protein